jgi:alcohol dehydrogenase class IV
MKFEFATATRIIFGPGTIQEAAPLAAQIGKQAFVVTGRTVERAEMLLGELRKHKIDFVPFSVTGEPTTILVKEALQQARQAKTDLVLGIGGGSVLDTGKVVAAMLTNSGQLEDYLEVVGQGKPLTQNPVPYIAIPTTAGTGAEVTRNAVIGVPEYGGKVSMRSPLLLPRIAIVDPELTYSMPPFLTATTGLDALTQLIEADVCNKANPLTDGICREGLVRVARSLRQVYEDGSNKSAREDMALASLFSGLALANAGLGAVHGLAGPLGGIFNIPHGLICARLLPYVMQANVQALQTRAADSQALVRYGDIAQLLTGKTSARAMDGVEWVKELCSGFKLPSLSEFGLREQDLPAIVARSQKSSSMKGNPITLTDEELMDILKKADKFD